MATDTAAGGNRANKKKKALDLTQLTKEDLVDRIKQLEFHVNQLKNVIAKGNESTSKPKPSLRPFDFSLYSRRHVAMKVAYLGWDYRGFVVQEDTSKTIEHELFEALIRTRLIESRETSNYHRCGRTDKGVSAFCQVISIDLRSNMLEGLGIVPSQKENTKSNPAKGELDYVNMLNRTLPPEIRVLCWAPTRCDFSARFDCERRVYKYFFPRGDLDIEKMNVAAQKLVGTHDFRNLCKMDVGNGVVEFTRTVDSASVNGPGGAFSMCTFTVISKAFLWHQIRCIMAVLYLVGKSLEEPDIIDQLFDVVNHPCKPQYTMASELPLNLYDCVYTDVTWKYDQDAVEKVMSHYQKLWAELNIKSTMLTSMMESLQEVVPSITLANQADTLLPDYRPHTKHRSLLERIKCNSLEDRKEHFAKRRKLDGILACTESE